MSYIQKFKSHPASEKVNHHLKLTFNKKLVTGLLITLAIPLTVTLSSTRQDIEKHASESNVPVVKGYIIKYKEAPLATTRSTSISSTRPISDRRVDLGTAQLAAKNNILGILGAKTFTSGSSISSAENIEILGEYDTAFNGIALNISKEQAEKILAQSPYVEAIYPNTETKISLMDSVTMIGSDKVLQIIKDPSGRVVNGKGINIAVLDTGVDYMHADLGKSTGTQIYNSKVIGGKDFVNNDENPIDDHGHGTHVASIIAGNGSLKGIAPEANIFAYKIFDSTGVSDDAKILLAIDFATKTRTDDTNLSNDIHIMNMSFSKYCYDGKTGQYYTVECGPDDPVAEALDNATAEGIISVVAAGNFGDNTGAIGMPGAARSAITVGSINKSKAISSFSSRGPVIWGEETIIKPEVVAPGEKICASKLSSLGQDNNCIDSSHVFMNGTSMAAPMVAGLAALVLQKYPLYNPSDIKYLITQSATKLGSNIDIKSQGYGLVDTRNLFDFDAPQPTPPIQKTDIIAFQDSYATSANAGTNYGKSNRIKVDGNPKKISYLKFDLSPLQGKRIISARLRLNIPSDTGAGSDNKFNIKKVGVSAWSEGKITYKNRPSSGTTIANFEGKSAGNVLDIDLKSYIANNLGSKVSFAITSEGTNELILISKDTASSRPRIIVEYQ